MSEQVTLGEVYRLVLAQSETLDEIRMDVKAQNGRVASHETRLSVLEDRGTRDTAARVTSFTTVIGGLIYAVYQAMGGK